MMKLDTQVRERARLFIDAFKDKGECEFVRDFAIAFPITIFLDLIGLPQDRLNQFLEWEYQLLHGTDHEARITSVRSVKDLLLETRSEEHTSELQSLMRISYAVFCLTKKKQ